MGEKNVSLSAHYLKLVAEQGSIEGRIEHAECFLRGAACLAL
jgi:hypothetical protein